MDNGFIRILHAGSSIAGTLMGVAMLTPLYATIGTLAWLEAASSRATRRS